MPIAGLGRLALAEQPLDLGVVLGARASTCSNGGTTSQIIGSEQQDLDELLRYLECIPGVGSRRWPGAPPWHSGGAAPTPTPPALLRGLSVQIPVAPEGKSLARNHKTLTTGNRTMID
jgi:hypothetical protein